MKLLFIHERVSANGAIESLSSHLEQKEIVIGRGGSSHIILSSNQLSLVHAKIFLREDKVYIQDLESLSGVRVNTTRVAQGVLVSGDVIQLGDLSFTVNISNDLVTLIHRSVVEEKRSEQAIIAEQVALLSVDTYLPRIAVLSLVSAVVVLLGYFVYPVVGGNFASWSSGPISNAHKVIENDCQRCHISPFEPVQDRECLSCHSMTKHAKGHEDFLAKHAGLSVRCAECHRDHNGDHALISRDQRTCVSCHGTMNALHKGSEILDVVSFDKHPEFRISVPHGMPGASRVSLGEAAGNGANKGIDHTPIKLNHNVHLRSQLREGETLQCNACHRLASDKKAMEPISFDKHCRECHALGFDERLPDSQIPHGNSEGVYPTLFAEYAKLLLLRGGADFSPSQGSVRLMPDQVTPSSGNAAPDVQVVQAQARKAEEELFTRTGCFLCHNYNEKSLAEQSVDGSHYSVTKPNIPKVWMTKARFDHGAHEGVSCESCHDKARTSTETQDLLLPPIKVCQECHIAGDKDGFVRSECAQCHVYHTAQGVPREKKQGISEFIHSISH